MNTLLPIIAKYGQLGNEFVVSNIIKVSMSKIAQWRLLYSQISYNESYNEKLVSLK